jgi:hypothetical protein
MTRGKMTILWVPPGAHPHPLRESCSAAGTLAEDITFYEHGRNPMPRPQKRPQSRLLTRLQACRCEPGPDTIMAESNAKGRTPKPDPDTIMGDSFPGPHDRTAESAPRTPGLIHSCFGASYRDTNSRLEGKLKSMRLRLKAMCLRLKARRVSCTAVTRNKVIKSYLRTRKEYERRLERKMSASWGKW